MYVGIQLSWLLIHGYTNHIGLLDVLGLLKSLRTTGCGLRTTDFNPFGGPTKSQKVLYLLYIESKEPIQLIVINRFIKLRA